MRTNDEYQEEYVRQALAYDRQLKRKGFTRLCNYRQALRSEEIVEFEKVLSAATDEHPLQRFLKKRPHLLVNVHSAQGCRWVKSEPMLNSHRTDFMIARMNSGGLEWTLIELQSPADGLFLKRPRRPGKHLREGIDQISQWRGEIKRLGAAISVTAGYPELTSDFRGVVIIGRGRDKLEDLAGDQRVQDLQSDHRLQITSYDAITRAARSALPLAHAISQEGSGNDCMIDHSV